MKTSLQQIARNNSVSVQAVSKIKNREKLTSNINLAVAISKETGLPFWEYISDKIMAGCMRNLLRKKQVSVLPSEIRKAEAELLKTEREKKQSKLIKRKDVVLKKLNKMRETGNMSSQECMKLEKEFHFLLSEINKLYFNR